jgi:ferredoxin-type protein NapF
MNFRVLKIARVVISLLVFLLITFVFIDFTAAFSSGLIKGILYLEFVPSLISFLSLAGLASAGFIIVLLLSMFFGRIYCSTLCPLGTLQDIMIWLRRRFSRKRIRYRKQRSFYYLSYFLLAFAALFLLLGQITPLLLLDPYSHYGRIAANLIRPVYLLLNNLGAFTLESMDIYTLYKVEPGITHWFSVAFSAIIFVLVVWLSLRYARLFCNSLCPVGTMLGLVSRISVFRISLNQSLCTSCGKCAAVCKAGCIDHNAKTVDFARCVGCLNCLTSCPDNGVNFGLRKRTQKSPVIPFNPGRRELLSGMIVGGITLAGIPLSVSAQGFGRQRHGQGQGRGPRPVIREYPVSPPGSISHKHFNTSCTACHLCVSACPTHVIKPSLLQYGLEGIMQPMMDYNASYCNFDCVICTEVCPTGALRPVNIDEKHTLQLGKVVFVKQNCVVFTDGTDCGACSEHCPTKAVKMRPWRGNLFLPEVEPEICVGCGACEYACPTDPKSIYVDGNPVHLPASKPKIEALEQPDTDEDFPF